MESVVRHWLDKVEAVGGKLSPQAIAKLERAPATAGREALSRTYDKFPEVQDASNFVLFLLNQHPELSASPEFKPSSSEPSVGERQMTRMCLSSGEEAFLQLPFSKRFCILKFFPVVKGMETWRGLDEEAISGFHGLSDSGVENWLRRQTGKHLRADKPDSKFKHVTYHCRIDGDRNFTFTGPFAEPEGTPLQVLLEMSVFFESRQCRRISQVTRNIDVVHML